MQRRGIALIDAIVGGTILGLSIAVIASTVGRALQAQTDGEKRMTAAWLADELLSMVLVKGPEEYPRSFDTSGEFEWPFSNYSFEVDIEELGGGLPYKCSAQVFWGNESNQSVFVETYIALRQEDDEAPPREPLERVDRDARYFDEEEGAAP